MTLELKNIGMIKEASVKIDGLTVIAGENDTGKSTVGKLLFSLIKASSRYKEDLEENKDEKLFSIIEKIYFKLRGKIDFSDSIDFRKLFLPPKFKLDIENNGVSAIYTRLDILNKDSHENSNIREHDLREIESSLNQLIAIYSSNDNIEVMQRNAFKKVLVSEFKGKITNQNTLDTKSVIEVYEGKNPIVDIVLLYNSIQNFKVYDELYFNDATFIESPILLQLSELIDDSKTYFEDIGKSGTRRPNVALHIKDLNKKVKESEYNQDFLDFISNDLDIENLISDLSEIINGNIKYNKKTKDFIYISNGKSYYNLNTATGIKSFGIMQMLVQSGFINERSLLILDEPEVHLHPEWQLKYAKFIVKLVENNINVLVTSHSPYMIQALKVYSENKGLVDKTNFYLAEKNEEEINSLIREVNDDMWLIFEKLSTPLSKLKMISLDEIL